MWEVLKMHTFCFHHALLAATGMRSVKEQSSYREDRGLETVLGSPVPLIVRGNKS